MRRLSTAKQYTYSRLQRSMQLFEKRQMIKERGFSYLYCNWLARSSQSGPSTRQQQLKICTLPTWQDAYFTGLSCFETIWMTNNVTKGEKFIDRSSINLNTTHWCSRSWSRRHYTLTISKVIMLHGATSLLESTSRSLTMATSTHKRPRNNCKIDQKLQVFLLACSCDLGLHYC